MNKKLCLIINYTVSFIIPNIINVITILSDILILYNFIKYNKFENYKYVKHFVKFIIIKWLYISIIITNFIIIIYKMYLAIRIMKLNNFLLILLNSFAKNIYMLKYGINSISRINEVNLNKNIDSKFLKLCLFTWYNIHNWQFILLNLPKQLLNLIIIFYYFKNMNKINLIINLTNFLIVCIFISFAVYSMNFIIFLISILSLIYIENIILCYKHFNQRWIPFLQEDQSSLKEFLVLKLSNNIERLRKDEDVESDKLSMV
jgi:hypothetical protein